MTEYSSLAKEAHQKWATVTTDLAGWAMRAEKMWTLLIECDAERVAALAAAERLEASGVKLLRDGGIVVVPEDRVSARTWPGTGRRGCSLGSPNRTRTVRLAQARLHGESSAVSVMTFCAAAWGILLAGVLDGFGFGFFTDWRFWVLSQAAFITYAIASAAIRPDATEGEDTPA